MNKTIKRLFSSIITTSMIIGTLVLPAAADGLDDDLLVNITFDEDGTSGSSFTATKGGTVTKNGTVAFVDSFDEEQGKALNIAAKSAANYLSLPDGLLQGKQAATFSFWVKATSDSNPNWPFMNTCEDSHAVGTEKYLGILINTGSITAERYNNTTTRLSSVSASSTDDWQYITAVYESGGTRIYQNGKLVASDTVTVNVPALFTANSKTWIGHANWGAGEGFQGLIDDFKIYGKALSEDEVKTISEKAIQREIQKAVEDKNRLEIDTKFYTNDKRSYTVEGNDVKINVPSSNEKNANVIAAAYDGDVLSNVVLADENKLIAGMNSFTLENVKKKETDTVKVYVWDSLTGITPIPDISVNNVFQISEGSSVTIKTNVTNSTVAAKSLVFDVTAYDAQGQAFVKTDVVIPSHHKTLDVLESAEFTETVTGAADAEYYRIEVIDVTDSANPVTYQAGLLPKANVSFPDASPEDTYGTTHAAHDPSIFKDPKTGVYYAYNTDAYGDNYTDKNGNTVKDTYPMDTFKSTDLIHWERIDNNFRIPEKATAFFNEIFEPIGSHANTGVWAPDMFYAEEDTEHPYWLYYSLSTNGSDYDYIRSAIGLVKGTSPEGPWTDCGIVVSSQNGDYNTNAIDSNIYVDTNGDRFFIWGSFQKGVHGVKLTKDGLAEGINYESNSTIHTSSKKFGARLFATPSGIMGPEGAWMINNSDAGYRYMFTSYGWLGTNYNIRVARNSLENKWADEMGSKSPHHKLLDHKDRKVGTAFTEQPDKTELWGYKMLGSYQLGDGLIYYGNGHNSVLHDDDDNWYLVEHCRKVPEDYATLQVRKMLWTADGWPVVSPLVYAGEDEQEIPEELLYGTWDLSSVGQYITENNAALDVSNFDNKQKVDLPVLSSQIILSPEGSVSKADGTEIGVWTYDDDHTVTLEFEQDGDTDNYEFYEDGDVMTLYVLTGYDKDKRESAIVMTGTDRNSITQLAKKNNAVDYPTKQVTRIDTTPTTVTKSTGGNPILGFDGSGNTLYAGDPAAMVEGDTVYLYAGHDTSTSDGYVMPEWVCYTSKDMKEWEYKGVTMKATDISWRNDNTSAWASQVIKYKDKYYMYYCTWTKADHFINSEGKTEYRQSIGVAVSDNPTGPFTDPLNAPLVTGALTEPQTSGWNDIDPTVWIETVDGEEHRYLAWGNGIFYVCELNEDMISVKDLNGDNAIKMNDDIKQQTFTNLQDGLGFTEAPWIYRQTDESGNYTGKYYLFAAFGWREQMGYATSDSMYGPWEFGGILMPPTATSNTNHPAVIDFKGHTYFIYHNGALPWGSGFRRSVCVEEFSINNDGTINPIQETSTGLTGKASTLKTSSHYLAFEDFTNSSADGDYPLKKPLSSIEKKTGSGLFILSDTAYWEIEQGKSDSSNENLVSIQSYKKPGLYVCADGTNVVLTQQSDTSMSLARKMTFKTVKGLDSKSSSVTVSFESVAKPGYFLTIKDGAVSLTDGSDADACSFYID